MSKAIIEFDLGDPEDRKDYEITIHAIDYHCGIYEFDNWLRSQIKYVDKLKHPTLEEIRTRLWEELDKVSKDFE